MATFTATVKTNQLESACTTEFEVDDAELQGLTPEARDELLRDKAEEAVWEDGLLQIYYDEAAAE